MKYTYIYEILLRLQRQRTPKHKAIVYMERILEKLSVLMKKKSRVLGKKINLPIGILTEPKIRLELKRNNLHNGDIPG